MRPVLSFFIIPEVYSRYVDVSTDYFKKCCSKIFKKLTKGDFVAKRRFVKVEEESGDSYTLDLVGESNPPTGYILLAQLDEEDGSKDISSLKCFYLTIKKNTSDSSFALSDASSIEPESSRISVLEEAITKLNGLVTQLIENKNSPKSTYADTSEAKITKVPTPETDDSQPSTNASSVAKIHEGHGIGGMEGLRRLDSVIDDVLLAVNSHRDAHLFGWLHRRVEGPSEATNCVVDLTAKCEGSPVKKIGLSKSESRATIPLNVSGLSNIPRSPISPAKNETILKSFTKGESIITPIPLSQNSSPLVAVKCSPQGHTKTSTPSHVSVRPFANSANKSAQADRAMNAAAQTVTPPSRPVRGAESADKSDSFIHSPSGNGSPDPRASASNSFETSKKRRVMDVPQITLNELNSIMERLQQQFNQETDQQEFPIFPKPTKAKRSKPI